MARENVQLIFKVLFITALVGGVILADVSAQLHFTENTRAGIYEASYQRQQKEGPP